MNLNANDEYENVTNDDDETDLWFITKAIEMHESYRDARSGLYREYDDAEERLMRDYFDFNAIQTLYAPHNTFHGFSGMLESIDHMH
uniref:Uncharacterized protein n=1 Tax=Tanacetum cinerariifolium TaxID=118510 RepID=A0A6L2MK22_TANCI|nr:hypothetical protein [Tanacetum cinerariifolium]